jgi:hypothetical protein
VVFLSVSTDLLLVTVVSVSRYRVKKVRSSGYSCTVVVSERSVTLVIFIAVSGLHEIYSLKNCHVWKHGECAVHLLMLECD